MKPCITRQEEITHWVSGTLPEDQRRILQSHFEECAGCKAYGQILANEDQQLQEVFKKLDAEMEAGAREAMAAVHRYVKPLPAWRKIMKSRITHFTAAALVILFLGLFWLLMEKSVTSAYAVEQTFQALRQVPAMHILGRDWNDEPIELWAKFNTENGLMEYSYLHHLKEGKVTVSTPQRTYHYDRKTNQVVTESIRGIVPFFQVNNFLYDTMVLTKSLKGQICTEKNIDSKSGRQIILLNMTSSEVDLSAVIDPETKLPLRVSVLKGQNGASKEDVKNADRISYEEPPAGTFDFKIPAGATVMEAQLPPWARVLPKEVVVYSTQLSRKSREQAKMKKNTEVSTIINIVDDQMKRSVGGLLNVTNRSGKPLAGEIGVTNFGTSDIGLLDERGNLQKIRLVQHRVVPVRYCLYLTLDRPLDPGQSRSYLWVMDKPRTQPERKSDGRYSLSLKNRFGNNVVENFILVLPSTVHLYRHSEPPIDRTTMGKFDVYAWQKYIPEGQEYCVQVEWGPKDPLLKLEKF